MDRSSFSTFRQECMQNPVISRWGDRTSRFLNDMSRLLDRYQIRPLRGMHRQRTFTPRVEVVENDNAIHVDAELPGVDEKDIDVTLTSGVLTITGEKKDEIDHTEEEIRCAERAFGAFSRTIPLPKHVDVNKAEAYYSNGLLCINMPKVETEMGRRKIPIRNG